MTRRELLLLGGAMVAAPAVRAQQKAMPVIGYLASAWPGANAAYVAAFGMGLGQTGWVEGQNVKIEYRWAEGQYDRLPDLAADLVHSGVEVIAASGGCTVTGGAKGATGASLSSSRAEAIPDARGFVSSLSRPGANMTGVALLVVELAPKRLELVRELVPKAAGIGALINPKNTNAARNLTALQERHV